MQYYTIFSEVSYYQGTGLYIYILTICKKGLSILVFNNDIAKFYFILSNILIKWKAWWWTDLFGTRLNVLFPKEIAQRQHNRLLYAQGDSFAKSDIYIHPSTCHEHNISVISIWKCLSNRPYHNIRWWLAY